MNSIDFCYWLQGYFEVANPSAIPAEQTELIKNHLNLVFKHEIDPLRESETVATKEELNEAHNTWPEKNPNDILMRC